MKAVKSALVVLAFSLLVAGAAGAQGWGGRGHGRDGGGREGGGQNRAEFAPRGGGFEGGRGDRGAGPREFRDRGPASPMDARFGAPAALAPRGYPRADLSAHASRVGPLPPIPGGALRRGQFLPRTYWGGAMLDPRQSRLRTPPPGYGWYGVGRDAYLVQRSTGLILDTAPGPGR